MRGERRTDLLLPFPLIIGSQLVCWYRDMGQCLSLQHTKTSRNFRVQKMRAAITVLVLDLFHKRAVGCCDWHVYWNKPQRKHTQIRKVLLMPIARLLYVWGYLREQFMQKLYTLKPIWHKAGKLLYDFRRLGIYSIWIVWTPQVNRGTILTNRSRYTFPADLITVH